MGNRRVLVLVGLVVIALAALLAVYFLRRPAGPSAEATPTPEVQTLNILVAANNLTRRMQISDAYVMSQPWPIDQLPPGGYFTDLADVVGLWVQVDLIPQGTPLAPIMLAQTPGTVGPGSDISRNLLPGYRAYAIPMDLLGAVAWTIQPGDRVDVLASWEIVNLDEDFQSTLPNQFTCIGADCSGTYGRLELLPNGQPVMVFPSAAARNRYVAQTTIQNVVVMGIGTFQTPETTTTREGEAPTTGEQAPTQPAAAQAVILMVTPQDALVLKALVELKANIDLALRSSDETAGEIATDPVSADYILNRYGIIPPPLLPYGVEAPGTNPLEGQVQTAATTRPAE